VLLRGDMDRLQECVGMGGKHFVDSAGCFRSLVTEMLVIEHRLGPIRRLDVSQADGELLYFGSCQIADVGLKGRARAVAEGHRAAFTNEQLEKYHRPQR